jgi:hypothetical protein
VLVPSITPEHLNIVAGQVRYPFVSCLYVSCENAGTRDLKSRISYNLKNSRTMSVAVAEAAVGGNPTVAHWIYRGTELMVDGPTIFFSHEQLENCTHPSSNRHAHYVRNRADKVQLRRYKHALPTATLGLVHNLRVA